MAYDSKSTALSAELRAHQFLMAYYSRLKELNLQILFSYFSPASLVLASSPSGRPGSASFHISRNMQTNA